MVDVRHIAWLARVDLRPEEEEEFKKLVEAVRSIVDKLLEAKVEDVEPLYHPLEIEGYVREDKVEKSEVERDTIFSNASRSEKGYIVAPRTVED